MKTEHPPRRSQAEVEGASQNPQSVAIPARALLFSLATLAVPVVAAAYAPDLLTEDRGLVLWLAPILPAFLLAYYRGWRGTAVVLASGMASLTAANLIFVISGLEPPSWSTMLTLVVVYLLITNGVAGLAELLHRERRAAERMAFTDELTGLANRRHADVHLERVFAGAVRGGGLAVVLFDLDHFKRVNDRFGHAVGDEVIRAMGDALKCNTRLMDLPARFGGEEFLVALTDIGSGPAVDYANRVCNDLRGLQFPWGRVTVSAGVAMYGSDMANSDELVAAADQALYEAKNTGRDRTVLAAADRQAELGDEANERAPGTSEPVTEGSSGQPPQRGRRTALVSSSITAREPDDITLRGGAQRQEKD